eukprot:TRINITY_DN1353_c0_g1_i2.p1 TRINITY_DN1353_c0_g1~~TRINITY_DN1353_c0_g1_i2.p1  ORF type:complete len:458 (-),score=87.45 TRINITY_DN1353_c0_g1_i2:773-2146(-)
MAKRRKRRTHVRLPEEVYINTPKSFVFKRGKCGKSVKQLVVDMQHLMQPYTADKLKSRKTNQLKDFAHVAGPLGITHFLVFSTTELGTYLRLIRLPHGPTLHFRVSQFSLMRDVINTQPLAQPATGLEFTSPPLVVLNNFNEQSKHMQLMAVTFQNLFPPINIQTIKPSECRRVVLVNYNKESDTIDLRQFAVTISSTGLSKSVKRIVQARIPNLHDLDDVAEYVLKGATASESDAEDGDDNKVDFSRMQHRDRRVKTSKSAVRLKELGPRMTLQLSKIEEEFCKGAIIYHRLIKKSPEELVELEKERARREREREKRRQVQAANVEKQRKAEEEQKELKRHRARGDDDQDEVEEVPRDSAGPAESDTEIGDFHDDDGPQADVDDSDHDEANSDNESDNESDSDSDGGSSDQGEQEEQGSDSDVDSDASASADDADNSSDSEPEDAPPAKRHANKRN